MFADLSCTSTVQATIMAVAMHLHLCRCLVSLQALNIPHSCLQNKLARLTKAALLHGAVCPLAAVLVGFRGCDTTHVLHIPMCCFIQLVSQHRTQQTLEPAIHSFALSSLSIATAHQHPLGLTCAGRKM
jgi:hypothetical protein